MHCEGMGRSEPHATLCTNDAFPAGRHWAAGALIARRCPLSSGCEAQGGQQGSLEGVCLRSARRAPARRPVQACAWSWTNVPACRSTWTGCCTTSASTPACPPRRQPLGGWEEPRCEVRGHFVGHYLSACALMYASTGDERLQGQGRRRSSPDWPSARRSFGNGYLSAFPEEFFDRVEAAQAGLGALLHAAQDPGRPAGHVRVLRQPQALEVAAKFGRLGHCPQRTAQRRADAEDARQRARRHERGPGQPLRA